MIKGWYTDQLQLQPHSYHPWSHHLVVLCPCLLSPWGRASFQSLFQKQILGKYLSLAWGDRHHTAKSTAINSHALSNVAVHDDLQTISCSHLTCNSRCDEAKC